MKLRELFIKYRSACVGIAIQIPTSTGVRFVCFGSGVNVHPSGAVVTAKHVVTSYFENIKKEVVDFSRPVDIDFHVLFSFQADTEWRMWVAKPIGIALLEKVDVAVLKLSPKPDGWATFDLPKDWDVCEGDSIATVGYPLRSYVNTNAFPNLFTGTISQIAANYDKDRKGWLCEKITMDMCIHPGNSGGPVFNAETGTLIGIVEAQELRPSQIAEQIACVTNNSKISDKMAAQVWTNISYCVPVSKFIKDVQAVIEMPALPNMIPPVQ
jgi:S1-C subfamily serine protease